MGIMKFYNCLFTILEKNIYTGVVKELSPNEYSRVHTYFRPDHGVSNHSKGFNPNEIPTYLLRFPFNF